MGGFFTFKIHAYFVEGKKNEQKEEQFWVFDYNGGDWKENEHTCTHTSYLVHQK